MTIGKYFQIQLPEAVTRSCSLKKVLLKISQYSQKNTCVGVFSNKVFYRPPFRRVTRRGGGRFPLSLLKDHKKCLDFGKIDPDSVHLLVKFSIQNVILKVSRRKNSKFSPVEPFSLKLFTIFLLKYSSSQKPSLPWKFLIALLPSVPPFELLYWIPKRIQSFR